MSRWKIAAAALSGLALLLTVFAAYGVKSARAWDFAFDRTDASYLTQLAPITGLSLVATLAFVGALVNLLKGIRSDKDFDDLAPAYLGWGAVAVDLHLFTRNLTIYRWGTISLILLPAAVCLAMLWGTGRSRAANLLLWGIVSVYVVQILFIRAGIGFPA